MLRNISGHPGSGSGDIRGLAARLDAMGCTPEEVERVELDQGVPLPLSFREFLTYMGRDAGGLFVGTDIAYPQILGVRTEAIALLAENDQPFTLNSTTAVVAMHQGYQFGFLDGAEGPDPAVWWWTEGGTTSQPNQLADSLLAWLLLEAGNAQHSEAIAARTHRRLASVSEPSPCCGVPLRWLFHRRWGPRTDEATAGRARMLGSCPTCERPYARWADEPSSPLIPGDG